MTIVKQFMVTDWIDMARLLSPTYFVGICMRICWRIFAINMDPENIDYLYAKGAQWFLVVRLG